jgi:hypothetical protein
MTMDDDDDDGRRTTDDRGQLCPAHDIVFFPVLISTYSHVENSIFFSEDFAVFFVTRNPLPNIPLCNTTYLFSGLSLKSPSYFLSLISFQ